MKCFALILFCFLISCSAQTEHTGKALGFLGVQSTTGVSGDAAYLRELILRLNEASTNPKKADYHTVLLQAPDPIALSVGNGVILISSGMIKSLNSESELAFILSHEIAHYELEHHKHITENSSSTALEQEADIKGLEIMTRAGFNPLGALNALEICNSLSEPLPYSIDHPSAAKRQEILKPQISALDIQHGILDRRVFQSFRRTL